MAGMAGRRANVVATWGGAVIRRALQALCWWGFVLFLAMAGAHWAACEQDDAVCAFTGSPAK